jgi:hypothetical protein
LTKKKLRILDHPDEWIIRNPIWTTCARYQHNINDSIIVDFGTDIADHGFSGQIEIDDYWEVRTRKTLVMI